MIVRQQIIAISTDNMGSGQYRIKNPARVLKEHFYANTIITQNPLTEVQFHLADPNGIIWHMQLSPQIKEIIKNYKKVKQNFWNAFEIDDWSLEVDEKSHHKNLPKDLKSRYQSILSNMDFVITSTPYLANKIHDEFHFKYDRIHIMPNFIPAQYLHLPYNEDQEGHKPRIGWAGGFSHQSDLELIIEAVNKTCDKYDWVFFGFMPEGIDSSKVTFVPAVSPDQYIEKLNSLNLDLAIAPLIESEFNKSKSNIKLLEYGICRFPILASPVGPYQDMDVNYVEDNTPKAWLDTLMNFDFSSPKKQRDHYENIKENYILESHVKDIADSWSLHKQAMPIDLIKSESLSIVGASSFDYPTFDTIEKAVKDNAGRDVLYIRPGTFITDDMLKRIKEAANTFKTVWTLSVLSNDSDSFSFPLRNQTNNVPVETAICIDDMVKNKDKFFPVAYPLGPVIYIKSEAFQYFGLPNAKFGDELALSEWSAISNISRHFLMGNVYATTFGQTPFDQQKLSYVANTIKVRYPEFLETINNEAISQEVSEYFKELDIEFHAKYHKYLPVESDWTYNDWEHAFNYAAIQSNNADKEPLKFCIVTKNKLTADITKRIPYTTFLTYDDKFCRMDYDYVAFLEEGDHLTCGSLDIMNNALKQNPTNVCYSDHDYFAGRKEQGTSVWEFEAPHFKRNFDYELLLSQNYVDGLTFISTSVLPDVIDIDETFDPWLFNWKTALENRKSISHVPFVLLHKTKKGSDFKVETLSQASKMVANHLTEQGINAVVAQHKRNPFWFQIRYMVSETFTPKISIIIPTKDHYELISRCLDGILTKTFYQNYEIIVIDNDSTDMKTLTYLKDISKNEKVKLIRYKEPFNWSAINNFGATHATGEYLLFLNNDTDVITGTWLHDMVATFQHKDVGSVGARLLNGNTTIQFCGASVWSGMAGHDFKNVPENFVDTFGLTQVSHETTANTGACLMTPKSLFNEIGGFDPEFVVSFNDVVYCLELEKMGYRNIVSMSAMLYHIESSTRGAIDKDIKSFNQLIDEGRKMQLKYNHVDKYLNPNYKEGDLHFKQLVHPPLRPFYMNEPSSKLLLINSNRSRNRMESLYGKIPYTIDINGTTASFLIPQMPNVPAYDLRDIKQYREFVSVLQKLGIDKIDLNLLYPADIQILKAIQYTEIPYDYYGMTSEPDCPQIIMKTDLRNCEYIPEDRNECTECIEKSGSLFGFVDIEHWRKEWDQFLKRN